MRSKLPRVREMTTQTDHSFLSDVHPERKATSGIQRYVEHDAYAGALWQPTDADQEDSCMVRMNTPISCLQNDKVTTWYLRCHSEKVRVPAGVQGRVSVANGAVGNNPVRALAIRATLPRPGFVF